MKSKLTKTLGTAGASLLLLVTPLSPAAAQTWIQLFPTGGPPINRVHHVGVYDPASNRMTIFGGLPFGIGTLTDTWVLADANGLGAAPAWIELTPTGGPPPTGGVPTAVYDPGSNRMIVFGGAGSKGIRNDVWVLTAANGLGGIPTWIQLVPDGPAPSARFIHSAVYDPASNRMTIYGGRFLNDVWVLSNANGLGGSPAWTELLPLGGPPAQRENHSAVYDPNSNRMIVFGGYNNFSGGELGDVWVLTNANGLGGTPTWVELSPGGTGPGPRAGHGAVYDATHNVLTIFGGGGCDPVCGPHNDVWTLSNANGLGGIPSWTQLLPGGGPPQRRFGMAMVYDPSNDRAIIQDGQDCSVGPGCSFPNDVWVLTTASGITTLEVAIDIKPGSFPNSINLGSRGVIPVAILTTNTFDATTVNPTKVLFGATGSEAGPIHSSLEDVDGDGDTDLILQFNAEATGIQCGNTSASLTGKTFGGQVIHGSDSVNTVGCK